MNPAAGLQRLRGLLVYRFAGPLYYFNAAYFANRVQELIDSVPGPVKVFLINAEAIVDMDYERRRGPGRAALQSEKSRHHVWRSAKSKAISGRC